MLNLRPIHATAEPCVEQGPRISWGRDRCLNVLPDAASLALVTAWGGALTCRVRDRSVVVDDDNFLILMPGHAAVLSAREARPVDVLAVSFGPDAARDSREFMEHLQPHDSLVTPVLRYLYAHLCRGLEAPEWFEEQLAFLLERLRAQQARLFQKIDSYDIRRPTTRREAYRRISLATDYINGHYFQDLGLGELARIACLSKFHFLRLFRVVHGMTPGAYLRDKRARVALRLLEQTELTVYEIAAQVGFSSTSTLLRLMRGSTRLSPRQIRNQCTVNRQSTPDSNRTALLA